MCESCALHLDVPDKHLTPVALWGEGMDLEKVEPSGRPLRQWINTLLQHVDLKPSLEGQGLGVSPPQLGLGPPELSANSEFFSFYKSIV